jgi:hypothetical protein
MNAQIKVRQEQRPDREVIYLGAQTRHLDAFNRLKEIFAREHVGYKINYIRGENGRVEIGARIDVNKRRGKWCDVIITRTGGKTAVVKVIYFEKYRVQVRRVIFGFVDRSKGNTRIEELTEYDFNLIKRRKNGR